MRMGDVIFFFFSSRRRHTRLQGDWSSDVCSSDLTWAGVRQPIDSAQTFVLQPLAVTAANDPVVRGALATYNAAPAAVQDKWVANYADAVTKVKFVNGNPVVPPAVDGPVPFMLATELSLARSGAIDTDLIAQR